MHAFASDSYGSAGTYREVPTPHVGKDEILIRVHAAGVNPIDRAVLAGAQKDRVSASFPLIPGDDVAGSVERTGRAVTHFAVGDEVFGRVVKATYGAGTYAEYVAVPPTSIIAAKPKSISLEQAAALPIPAMTALAALDDADIQAGEAVVVVGATGAVGGYAVQIAAQRGAHVTGTADPDREGLVRSLGAAEVVDYQTEDVAAAIRATHPDGVDLLIDSVSDAAGLPPLTETVRPGGRVVSMRFAADVDDLAKRNVQGTNFSLRAVQTVELLRAVAGLVDTGRIVVLPFTSVPLHRSAEVLGELASPTVRGKIVLSMLELP